MMITKITERAVFAEFIPEICMDRIKNNQCPACGKPKAEWTRRTDWACCSTECSNEYYDNMRQVFDPAVLREKTLKRDDYTCAVCGVRHVELYGHEHKLVADHIVPIAMGGDQWDMDNLQTLCRTCDKKKTRKDQGDIGKVRRIEKMLSEGQVQLCK